MNLGRILLLGLIFRPAAISRAMSTVLVLFLLVAVPIGGYLYVYKFKREWEIERTPPMALDVDKATGWRAFDVNRHRNFGSDALLAAAMKSPIVLTGGVLVQFENTTIAELKDTGDENLKTVEFGQMTSTIYVPASCIRELAKENERIFAKRRSVPRPFVVDPKKFDLAAFSNKACPQRITPAEAYSKCVIRVTGQVELGSVMHTEGIDCEKPRGVELVYVFDKTLGGPTLKRQLDLEQHRRHKPEEPKPAITPTPVSAATEEPGPILLGPAETAQPGPAAAPAN